jgi:hypothetical protein
LLTLTTPDPSQQVARKVPIFLTAKLFAYNTLLYLPFAWTALGAGGAHILAPPAGPWLADWLEATLGMAIPPPPAILSAAVEVFHHADFAAALGSVCSWLSAGMFLMLSFRVNRAAARWWEAHSRLGAVHSECRSLLAAAQMYVRDPRLCADVGVDLLALARALQYQLARAPQAHWDAYFPRVLSAPGTLAPAAAVAALDDAGGGGAQACPAALLRRAPRDRPFLLVHRVSLRLGHALERGEVGSNAQKSWNEHKACARMHRCSVSAQ